MTNKTMITQLIKMSEVLIDNKPVLKSTKHRFFRTSNVINITKLRFVISYKEANYLHLHTWLLNKNKGFREI